MKQATMILSFLLAGALFFAPASTAFFSDSERVAEPAVSDNFMFRNSGAADGFFAPPHDSNREQQEISPRGSAPVRPHGGEFPPGNPGTSICWLNRSVQVCSYEQGDLPGIY